MSYPEQVFGDRLDEQQSGQLEEEQQLPDMLMPLLPAVRELIDATLPTPEQAATTSLAEEAIGKMVNVAVPAHQVSDALALYQPGTTGQSLPVGLDGPVVSRIGYFYERSTGNRARVVQTDYKEKSTVTVETLPAPVGPARRLAQLLQGKQQQRPQKVTISAGIDGSVDKTSFTPGQTALDISRTARLIVAAQPVKRDVWLGDLPSIVLPNATDAMERRLRQQNGQRTDEERWNLRRQARIAARADTGAALPYVIDPTEPTPRLPYWRKEALQLTGNLLLCAAAYFGHDALDAQPAHETNAVQDCMNTQGRSVESTRHDFACDFTGVPR